MPSRRRRPFNLDSSAPRQSRSPASGSAGRNSFRIIAGHWRGRRLEFPPNAELRPSADRVRETLFNWLQPHVAGARCLDLFAGSGALVLEALSRGAALVVAIDNQRTAVAALQQHGKTLPMADGQQLQTLCADSRQWLSAAEPPERPFTLVFLDPPFRRDWLPLLLAQLERPGWLADNALVYIEYDKNNDETAIAEALASQLSPNWVTWRQQSAGQVAGRLLRWK